MTISESMLTATDEAVISTANKYIVTQITILNKVNISDTKKEEIKKNIKYVSECVYLNDITTLQKFFSDLLIPSNNDITDDQYPVWFWKPLSTVH